MISGDNFHFWGEELQWFGEQHHMQPTACV